MFDIAWSEILVILVVAFIVISPEDIPKVLKAAKGWIKQLRDFKDECTGTINNIIHDAELQQAKEALQQETAAINSRIRQIVDLEGNVREAYDVSDILPENKREERNAGDEPAVMP